MSKIENLDENFIEIVSAPIRDLKIEALIVI
jgi:hypothetical protein